MQIICKLDSTLTRLYQTFNDMSNLVTTIENGLISQSRADGITELLKESLAKNSHTAYDSDWSLFEAYCNGFNLSALPATPVIVADFISNVRTLKGERYKPSSLQRFLVSIKRQHKRNGFDNPTRNALVLELMRGVRKSETRGIKQAAAMKLSKLVERVITLPDTNKALRDKALLLIGFGGA